MSIDASAIERRIKSQKRLNQLGTRNPSDLMSVSDIGDGIPNLLFDTNVYIKNAAGTLPPTAESVVDRCNSFHCSVCIGELMTGVGNRHPAHPSWIASRNHIFGLVGAIPDHKLLGPDEDIWAEAGLIAGTLARIQNFQPHQRKECLNDALIYLTSAKVGIAVLTENRQEFDWIQQLAGRGNFVYF